MKAPIVTFSVVCLLSVTAAVAQDARRRQGAGPAPKADPKVYQAEATLPAPVAPDEIKPATLALPTDPIEPWLLTKQAGPFMVVAKAFRGPEAERFALALAKELRRDYGLPSYILRTKDFPMRSLIRNVPPTAPNAADRAHLTEPEKVRSYDEAMVIVGNEKTLAGSEALWHKVKKIKPKCLDDMPSIYGWRAGQGLSTATRTTNPYQPTQNLFPGRGQGDPLVAQMNGGPRSVYKCPGRYSLQVAHFGGRSAFNADEKEVRGTGDGQFKLAADGWFKKSPLETAADDAEVLAELLAKNPKLRALGAQPYVYHDRTSSKVMIGSFNSPTDPAAVELRNLVLQIPGDRTFAANYKRNSVLAPATMLTDLEDPNRPIKTH